MHILVFADQIYPDAIGGVGKSLYNECLALRQCGHTITILVRGLDHKLPPETIIIEGLTIHRFQGPQHRSILYYAYPLATIYHSWSWLHHHREKYDIFYIHNPFFLIGIYLTPFTYQPPIVYMFHSSIGSEIHISAQHRKYGRLSFLFNSAGMLIQFLERLVLSHVDTLLARSHFMIDQARQLNPGVPIYRSHNPIPLGVDITHYQPQPKAEARHGLNLPLERFVVLTVRRLEGRMGLSNLIDAIALIKVRFPDILLLIAGKGTLRLELEQSIATKKLEDQVRLLGFVPEDDLPIYLSAADMFVLPTEALEGFGLATIEALAAGLPVLGTPIGATPEILAPLDPHLLTENESPEALAAGLEYWLENRGALPALAIRCRFQAETVYDKDIIAKQLEQCFEKASQL